MNDIIRQMHNVRIVINNVLYKLQVNVNISV